MFNLTSCLDLGAVLSQRTGGAAWRGLVNAVRRVPAAGNYPKSSLGDAESSLRDAKSSLGDVKSSLGDA
jgi:hypothetical protein